MERNFAILAHITFTFMVYKSVSSRRKDRKNFLYLAMLLHFGLNFIAVTSPTFSELPRELLVIEGDPVGWVDNGQVAGDVLEEISEFLFLSSDHKEVVLERELPEVNVIKHDRDLYPEIREVPSLLGMDFLSDYTLVVSADKPEAYIEVPEESPD